jgi:hypothetical protein
VGTGEARVVMVRRVRASEHASEGTLSGTLPREVARTRRAMTKDESWAMTKAESRAMTKNESPTMTKEGRPAMTKAESRAMADEGSRAMTQQKNERPHHSRTRFM